MKSFVTIQMKPLQHKQLTQAPYEKAVSMMHCIYLGKNGCIDIGKWDWFIIVFIHAKIYKLKHGTMGQTMKTLRLSKLPAF